MSVEFNPTKMLRLVQLDNYLFFLLHSLQKKNPDLNDEQVLEIMFNTYVVGDSSMEELYNQTNIESKLCYSNNP